MNIEDQYADAVQKLTAVLGGEVGSKPEAELDLETEILIIAGNN